MKTLFIYAGCPVFLKERKEQSSILKFAFDDKYLEFEIDDDSGEINENSIDTNMNKAQIHFNLNQIRDMYLDEDKKYIWKNEKGNVYLLDCGSGFASGRLACMCIETGERFYSR